MLRKLLHRPVVKADALEARPLSGAAWVALLIAALVVAAFLIWPASLMDKLFFASSPVCPQRPLHSVFIAGQQMPMEARMVGMFSGALLTLLYAAARRRLSAAAFPNGWQLGLWLALIGSMAFDGTQALLWDLGILRLYEPNLFLRLGTGLASGVAIAMLLVPLVNQSLWRTPRREVALFDGWRDVAGVLVVQAAFFALTLADIPVLLVPLSLFNTIGVTVIFTAIFAVTVVMIVRRLNRYTSWRDAAVVWLAGFDLAALFLFALAAARLAVFGPGPLVPG